jgi:site-specific DNA-methyltransferase (cytosine-N4-specific)
MRSQHLLLSFSQHVTPARSGVDGLITAQNDGPLRFRYDGCPSDWKAKTVHGKKSGSELKSDNTKAPTPRVFHRTKLGCIYHGDALAVFRRNIKTESVDLIMTSPPFGLVRKKDYGNADAEDYLDWFRPFAESFRNALKPAGSLVIDIGGAWIPGQPTRSLYHYELLIMLCKEFDMHLAQDFFWWSPSKLPTPAEWVNIRRIRVKDAINCVWWLSPTPWPKASNRRVLAPYSNSMQQLLKNGYKAKLRPSGHDISEKFSIDNGAAIPPNLIALPNTESNSYYLRYCSKLGIKPHPARFPSELPELFIRMLTDPGDLVVDPFGGSCVTGEAAERTKRRWVCSELIENYLIGALGRFQTRENGKAPSSLFDADARKKSQRIQYSLYHPGALWNGDDHEPLAEDGGRTRPRKR